MKSQLLFLVLFTFLGCATGSKFTQGKVEPANFYGKSEFTTAKSLILLACELDGEPKNFLFDTGAQLTAIQRDSIFGETLLVRGGSNRVVENGSETVKSLKISGVDFVNTFASNENMTGLKEQIPNFGGVLGRTVIDKANWLIDYPNRTVTFANKNLSDDSFADIPLVEATRTPYTMVEFAGNVNKAIIDLGSTSVFNVPRETALAKALLDQFEFVENSRDRYTVGGTETIKELVGTVPLLKIGNLEFTNVKTNINQSSQVRLGMGFFKEYVIYIDNANHKLSIKSGSASSERF